MFIYLMLKLNPDSHCSLNIDKEALEQGVEQILIYIFRFSRIYQWISKYICLSKNSQKNIQIYSYWGNSINTNINNIKGPLYSSIRIF